MHEKTLNIIYKWLKQRGYNISLTELQRQFFSHPDVGTLISITDTLNDFSVANQAAQIDSAYLTQLTEPFIAYIKRNQTEQFVLVTPVANQTFNIYNGNDEIFPLSFDAFTNVFGGIIIAIDKQERTSNGNIRVRQVLFPFVAALSACVLLFLQTPLEFSTVAFHVLTLAGCTFTVLLFAHELGFKSNLLNRFCTISNHSNCNSVLQSHAARINKYVSLTDVGIIYFSFQLLYLLFVRDEYTFLYAISLLAATFSLYSVYQQAFVIKKWCPLCLGVVAVLILQGIIAGSEIDLLKINAEVILSSLCMLLLISTGWYYFKTILNKNNKQQHTEIDLLSFKRNYHLFLPFYKSEPPVEDAAISNQPEIIIGNQSAPVYITLITNPLCEACQKAHKELTVLLHRYPYDVALRIVFYVPYQNLNDPRSMIAGWLVETYLNNKEEGITAIDNWYTNPYIKGLDSLKLPKDIIKNQQKYLQNHSKWCVQQRLTLTPLLLLNNKLFPLIYRTEDLRFHIEAVIECEKSKDYEVDKSFQSTTVLVDNT